MVWPPSPHAHPVSVASLLGLIATISNKSSVMIWPKSLENNWTFINVQDVDRFECEPLDLLEISPLEIAMNSALQVAVIARLQIIMIIDSLTWRDQHNYAIAHEGTLMEFVVFKANQLVASQRFEGSWERVSGQRTNEQNSHKLPSWLIWLKLICVFGRSRWQVRHFPSCVSRIISVFKEGEEEEDAQLKWWKEARCSTQSRPVTRTNNRRFVFAARWR